METLLERKRVGGSEDKRLGEPVVVVESQVQRHVLSVEKPLCFSIATFRCPATTHPRGAASGLLSTIQAFISFQCSGRRHIQTACSLLPVVDVALWLRWVQRLWWTRLLRELGRELTRMRLLLSAGGGAIGELRCQYHMCCLLSTNQRWRL